MVSCLIDRSRDMCGISLMNLFNEFIRDMSIIDVPLENKKFTWSNKQLAPIFFKLDYFLFLWNGSPLSTNTIKDHRQWRI
jgi:hypothetical protein